MKIDFTFQQLQVIDKAIQQLPYYVAAPLIEHINKQLEQEKEKMDVPLSLEKTCPKTHQQNGN